MNAELIAVGTELLLGDTINTDAAAVARLLSELGINVYWQTVVGDNRARLEQAVQLASQLSTESLGRVTSYSDDWDDDWWDDPLAGQESPD